MRRKGGTAGSLKGTAGAPSITLRDAIAKALGRSPGSQVGIETLEQRLPMPRHSGVLLLLDLLTVAGAAPGLLWELSPERTGFPFHPKAKQPSDT
jgi:hypothetical protein